MFVLLHPAKTLQEKNLPTLYDRPEKALESGFGLIPMKIPKFVGQ
jgi:hypothetical protein